METHIALAQHQKIDGMKSDFSMASILMDCGTRKKDADESTVPISPERDLCALKNEQRTMTHEGLSALKLTDSEEARKIRVNLEEEDLWKNFHRLTNEMIVTKNGR